MRRDHLNAVVSVFWSLFIPFAAVLLWAVVDNVRDDAHRRE
jgi:hypothetical protein